MVTGQPVVVPTTVLAELLQELTTVGHCRCWLVTPPRCLGPPRDTDRKFARYVGSTLGAAGVGSEYLADVHVAAAAAEAGGGAVVTGGPDDLARLCAPYRFVTVERL